MWRMNPYQIKSAGYVWKLVNISFCSMISFSRIAQTRIAMFPLLTYILTKVLFHQWFFFFIFFQPMTPVFSDSFPLITDAHFGHFSITLCFLTGVHAHVLFLQTLALLPLLIQTDFKLMVLWHLMNVHESFCNCSGIRCCLPSGLYLTVVPQAIGYTL